MVDNFDGECTCEVMVWEPAGDGFKGCPFCETYEGEWEEDEEEGA